jgi:DNA-directed RNA polymerase alpha subunit
MTNLHDDACCYLGCDQLMGSVDDLELTVRSTNVLKNNGLTTVDQVKAMTWWDLMRLRNIGKTCAKEIWIAARAYPKTPEDWWIDKNPFESSWPWRPL